MRIVIAEDTVLLREGLAGLLVSLRRDERGDDLRIEGRSALGHPCCGVEEIVHLEHPVLEQVPEAAS